MISFVARISRRHKARVWKWKVFIFLSTEKLLPAILCLDNVLHLCTRTGGWEERCEATGERHLFCCKTRNQPKEKSVYFCRVLPRWLTLVIQKIEKAQILNSERKGLMVLRKLKKWQEFMKLKKLSNSASCVVDMKVVCDEGRKKKANGKCFATGWDTRTRCPERANGKTAQI